MRHVYVFFKKKYDSVLVLKGVRLVKIALSIDENDIYSVMITLDTINNRELPPMIILRVYLVKY